MIEVGDFVTHKTVYTSYITEVIDIKHEYGNDRVWVWLSGRKQWDRPCNFTLVWKAKPLVRHRLGVKI